MKKVLIRKYSDYGISVDSNFNMVFNDYFSGKIHSYPIVIDDSVTIDVPENYYSILDFMNHQKEFLEGDDVYKFLHLIHVEITPFIWLLMKDLKIDIFFNQDSLYVVDFNSEKYIVFNGKNMSVDIFDKMYSHQFRTNNACYNECKEELYTFVSSRMQNSIGHNEFVNCQIEGFKSTKKQMESEFLKEQQFDIKKALFLYENIIRIKERYLNEDHTLLSQEVIDEIANTVNQIRVLLNNPPTYTTDKI